MNLDKLRQKITPEICDKTRHRLPEQRKKRIDKRLPSKRGPDDNRAMGLEDNIREPSEWTELKRTGTATSSTWTEATHGKMSHLGMRVGDHSCRLMGYLRSSMTRDSKPSVENLKPEGE